MVYSKQTWQNLPNKTTPLSAARLTHIEDGIVGAHDAVAGKADVASVYTKTQTDLAFLNKQQRLRSLGGAIPALVRRLKGGRSHATIAQFSDSTGTDAGTYFPRFAQWLADLFPVYTTRYWKWNDATQAWNEPVTLRLGTAGARRYPTGVLGSDRLFQVANSPATTVTGDLRIDVRAAIHLVPSLGEYAIASKSSAGGQVSWVMRVLASGRLRLVYSPDGTTFSIADSTVSIPLSSTPLWYRVDLDVDNGAAGRTVTFSSSPDRINWSVIGTPIVQAGVTSLFAASAPTQFPGTNGSVNASFTEPISLYEMRLYNGFTSPSPVVHFDMAGISDPYGGALFDYAGNAVNFGNDTGLLAGAPVLDIFNEGIGGTTLGYVTNATRFPKITPHPADLAFVNYGHNEDAATDAWIAAWETFTKATLPARWPKVGIVAVTQNPRRDPATRQVPHLVRQDMVAQSAMLNGFALIDAGLAFIEAAAPTVNVSDDGVHPTTAGYILWEKQVRDMFLAWYVNL